jgi:TPR repeat protein
VKPEEADCAARERAVTGTAGCMLLFYGLLMGVLAVSASLARGQAAPAGKSAPAPREPAKQGATKGANAAQKTQASSKAKAPPKQRSRRAAQAPAKGAPNAARKPAPDAAVKVPPQAAPKPVPKPPPAKAEERRSPVEGPPSRTELPVAPTESEKQALPPARPLSTDEAEAAYVWAAQLQRRGELEAAIRAYHQAAENGHAPAQKKLGDMYGTGNSIVERDYETSLRWYQRARDQGVETPRPFKYPGVRR